LEDMIQKLLAAMKDTGDNGIVTEAGANQPGVRDGTGPAKGSFRKEVEGKTIGRRLAAGGPCPATTLAKGVKAPELPVAEGVKMATLLEALRKTKTAAILKQAIITVKGENIGKKGSIVEDILTRAGIV